MADFSSAYTLTFLGLAWGCALATIVLSWVSADHGLREFILALRSRDEKRAEVNALKQREPAFKAEYSRIYSQLQKQCLIVNEQTTALFELYQHTVQTNSRYSDIDMIIPEKSALPRELAAPEPPPLTLGDWHDSGSAKEK